MSKIPQGFATVTPTLIVEGAAQAIDLYAKAFGAKEDYRLQAPNSDKIGHACITIGNSKVFLCDPNPQMCAVATPSSFYLYVDDVDATLAQAKASGLEERSAPQDMFWGDRVGNVKDRFGISWTVATHQRDVSPQELEEGAKKMFEARKAA